MNKIKYLYLIVISLYSLSCTQTKVLKNEATGTADIFQAARMPEIPAVMTNPEQRAVFLAKHYWDNSDFTDTTYISRKEQTEQAWVDYFDMLSHVPLGTAQESIKAAFTKATANKQIFVHFAELADKYLYDPNSPMRSEEFYIPVLEVMTGMSILNDVEKIRPLDRLSLAMKNRPGTKALDFTYTLASGQQSTLHRLRAEYTILFINNPGCHACAEAIAGLKSAPFINQLHSVGKLKILSFYTDSELDEWQKHRMDFPSGWINGYDKKQEVTEKNLYDLKAIPTFYLLDKNKTVLLKDAPLPSIETWLSTYAQ